MPLKQLDNRDSNDKESNTPDKTIEQLVTKSNDKNQKEVVAPWKRAMNKIKTKKSNKKYTNNENHKKINKNKKNQKISRQYIH